MNPLGTFNSITADSKQHAGNIKSIMEQLKLLKIRKVDHSSLTYLPECPNASEFGSTQYKASAELELRVLQVEQEIATTANLKWNVETTGYDVSVCILPNVFTPDILYISGLGKTRSMKSCNLKGTCRLLPSCFTDGIAPFKISANQCQIVQFEQLEKSGYKLTSYKNSITLNSATSPSTNLDFLPKNTCNPMQLWNMFETLAKNGATDNCSAFHMSS